MERDSNRRMTFNCFVALLLPGGGDVPLPSENTFFAKCLFFIQECRHSLSSEDSFPPSPFLENRRERGVNHRPAPPFGQLWGHRLIAKTAHLGKERGKRRRREPYLSHPIDEEEEERQTNTRFPRKNTHPKKDTTL